MTTKNNYLLNEVVMPGEKFSAVAGEISAEFQNHVRNAYQIELKRLKKGQKVNARTIEMRLHAIRTEAKKEMAAMLLEFPGRFQLTDTFAAEDLAFLYSTAKELISKKARLNELKGE